jgi:hypothetical protein
MLEEAGFVNWFLSLGLRLEGREPKLDGGGA